MNSYKDEYIKGLEETINKFMAPLKNIPFSIVIKILSGCEVLNFSKTLPENKKALDLIIKAIKIAGLKAYRNGIYRSRPNEAGNKVEPFVKEALLMLGYQLETDRRGGKMVYVPKHWRLYTLEKLAVNIKHEFNQNNRTLYGSKSDISSLLAEGNL